MLPVGERSIELKQPLREPKSNKNKWNIITPGRLLYNRSGKTHNRNHPMSKFCKITTLQAQLKTKFITNQYKLEQMYIHLPKLTWLPKKKKNYIISNRKQPSSKMVGIFQPVIRSFSGGVKASVHKTLASLRTLQAFRSLPPLLRPTISVEGGTVDRGVRLTVAMNP